MASYDSHAAEIGMGIQTTGSAETNVKLLKYSLINDTETGTDFLKALSYWVIAMHV